MIRRTFRNVVQLVGIMGLGFAVFVGVLVWRLTTGPISLAFLTPYFESALKTSDSQVDIKLEDTILTWAGWDQSLDIRLRGAKAVARDGKVIAEIPELAVTLSAAALMKGELAPRSLSIFGPILNVVRTEVGKLELGLVQAGKRIGAEADLAGKIIAELLSPPDMKRPLGYLRRINIIGGNVTVDDRQLAVKWNAPETDIALIREGEKVAVKAELILKAGDQGLDKTAAFTLLGNYDLGKKEAKMTLGFADLNPVIFAPLSEKLKSLASFNLPLSGTVDAIVLADGEIRKFEFNLTSTKGQIALQDPLELDIAIQSSNLRGDYDQKSGRLNIQDLTLDLGKNGKLKLPAPVNHEWPMQKIMLAGTYDSDFDRLEVENLSLITGGPALKASATVQEIGGDISFELGGEATNLNIDEADKLWPKGWGDTVRDWILQNLSDGSAPIAHARVTGRYNKSKGVEIISLLGDMDIRNLTVDYLAPMPKATNGTGRAKFDRKRFDIEITGGRSGELMLRKGRVTFTGLDKVDQYLDAKLEIDGPLGEALTVVDSKPLEFAKSIGFSAIDAKGDVRSKIALNFLLERKMTADTVKATTEAVLKNVDISKIAIGLDLSKADLILSADTKGMTIKGDGLLGGVKTKILWHENFTDLGTYQRKYELQANIDDRSWREKLNLNFIPFSKSYMTGVIGADVVTTMKADGSGNLSAKLDLKDTVMALPKLGWFKSAKVAAKAVVNAKYSKAGFTAVPKVTMSGGGMEMAAKVSFSQPGEFSKAEIGRLRFGQTDVQADIYPRKPEGWRIDLSGTQLDLKEWIAQEDDSVVLVKTDPLDLKLDVKLMHLYPNKSLQHVAGEMAFDGWVWHQVNVKSSLGENKNLAIHMTPKGKGRDLRVTSNDAGAALQMFDYYDNLLNGRLTLTGTYAGMLPNSRFKGRAIVDDFRVVKAPVLAELLNVASITGILENLTGLGIAFNKMDVPFENDNGEIKIKNASVSGLSLGLTAEGTLNTDVETIDVKGTIVPAYALNNALTNIPLIGGLLSGGEKDGGVFAANYTMKGTVKDPKISTNPLSILAPGFLRNLFKIFDRPADNATQKK
ncbi:MAG: hypothetical protein HOG95_04755 [Rhodospirillaceae bacterium]|nr:hypothetical protein [Rhodospirillaceae bacterium]MBT4587849.1 hypothetical protein [Rhodospirillaceae bacterium]MBT5939217.1 hypothetical protein [Rhodospirillaceae bacterium]MBT7267348.1 hypothetical protein [Rhodospirillaceae bacterium]